MRFKKFFPKRIFLRFALLIIFPVITIQLISTYVFYQIHIKNVVHKISKSTIQKIALISNDFDENNVKKYTHLEINFSFEKNKKLKKKNIISKDDKYLFFDQRQFFIKDLLELVNDNISIRKRDAIYTISIQKNNGVINFYINKNDLTTFTSKIFMIWNIFLSLITLIIALIFMKNQLKPIKLLKKNLRTFTLNQEIDNLKPTGAKEIRELIISFLEMEKKLKIFINQRTTMLAGISHDLRTPLTRMKLALEFVNNDIKNMFEEDINYMIAITNEYLIWTKNINEEKKEITNIYDYINLYVKKYKKIHKNVIFKTTNINKNELVFIQKNNFERVIQNILDNAYKFATKAIITLNSNEKKIYINIDDNGKGVKKDFLSKLSEPFYKIDKSRNNEKGIGLGLSIAKDIILSNNGMIFFDQSKIASGLNVKIELNLVENEINL